jgi:ElaB/YqjD/DUF883 family membrane-anchored ribosome-binding protein
VPPDSAELNKEIFMEQTGKPATTSGTNRPIARAVDDASASVHGTIDKMSASARPTVDRLSSGAHQAVEKIAMAASDAAESLGAKADQLNDVQTRMTEQCRGYVHDNPLAAVGIALATGFVLSRLLRSR